MTNNNSKPDEFGKNISGYSKFHLEADRTTRGMGITISGVIGVSSFSDCEIMLKTHSGRIKIEGARLDIRVYESGTVEICGKVKEIGFIYGKN